MKSTSRSVSYIFLFCVLPLIFVAAGVRAFRIPGVYQSVGAILFGAICIAAWILGARFIKSGTEQIQRLIISGGLLLTPFAIMSLFWVGIGPPWEATDAENVMRYVVLLAASVAITAGFVVLRDELSEAGERIHSTLGFVATILAGTAYLVFTTFELGAFVAKVRDGQVPLAISSMSDVIDVILFFACVLTYLATAEFAVSLGRTRLLGRGTTRAYVIANIFALMLILIRGLSFPDPKALSTPWYTRPGFIAGIPAIPWIMPYCLGVVLLRRAGDRAMKHLA